MPAGYRDMRLVLTCTNLMDRGIAQAVGQFKIMNSALDLTQRKYALIAQKGKQLETAGLVLAGAGGLVLGWMYKQIGIANAYADAMAYARTQTHGLHISLKDLEKGGMSVMSKVPISDPTKQLGEGYYQIFSSLSDVKNVSSANKLLTTFAKASIGGNTDVATVAKKAISEINAFHLPLSKTNDLLDVQFKMVSLGRGHYAEFANVLGQVIPVMAAGNQTVQEMSGDLAFLTRSGSTAGSAAAELSRAMETLYKPAFQAGLKGLGINLLDSHGKMKQLNTVVTEISNNEGWKKAVKKAGSVGEAFVQTFGTGTVQARRFFDLAIPRAQQMNDITGAMFHAKGAAQQAYDVMSESPKVKLQKMKNQWHALAIEVGQAMQGIWTKVVHVGEAIMGWVDKLNPHVKKFAIQGILIASAIALVLGPLAILAGVFMRAWGALKLAGGAKAFGIFSTALNACKDAVIGIMIAFDVGPGAAIAIFVAAIVAVIAILYLVIKYHKQIWEWMQKTWSSFTHIKQWKIILAGIGIVLGMLLIWFAPVIAGIVAIGVAIFFIVKYHKDLIHWAQVAWHYICVGVDKAIEFFKKWWPVFLLFAGPLAWTIAAAIKWHKELFHILNVVFHFIVAVFKAVWHVIEPIVKVGWAVLLGIFKVAASVIVLIWRTLWAVVVGVFKVVWAVFSGIFHMALDAIHGKWGAVWNDILTMFTQIWNAIKDALVGILKAIWGFLVGFFKEMWQMIFTAGKDIVSAIWTGIKFMWHVLQDGAFALLHTFVSGLSWLGDEFFKVGGAIVHGLWNGIKAIWNNVIVKPIKGLASGVVGAVKDIFGIFSPSRVFHDIGHNIALGMANGIGAGASKVQHQMNNLTKMRPPAVALAGNYKPTGSAGNSITINIHKDAVNIAAHGANEADLKKLRDQTAQQIADEIAKKLYGRKH